MNFQTPLEASRHRRISQSAEIGDFLNRLAAASDEASCATLGWSVRGQPIRALICTRPSPREKPRVMLVGSHHGGSEPAGGEALMEISRALLHGDLRDLLDVLDVIVVPNVNPDGRDEDSSRNANGVNLNRDYVLLSQPESRALDAAVQRYRPHVVLDAHESAALKR
ncbi:MAG: M14 family zinc carboxypeptidase, partial [Gammaproteobacteria bacterium]